MSDSEHLGQPWRDARPSYYDDDTDSALHVNRGKPRRSRYIDSASDDEEPKLAPMKPKMRLDSPRRRAGEKSDPEPVFRDFGGKTNSAGKHTRSRRKDYEDEEDDQRRGWEKRRGETRSSKNYGLDEDDVTNAGPSQKVAGSKRSPGRSTYVDARKREGNRRAEVDPISNELPPRHRLRSQTLDDDLDPPQRRSREKEFYDEPDPPRRAYTNSELYNNSDPSRRRPRGRDMYDEPEPPRRRNTEKALTRDRGHVRDRLLRDGDHADPVPRHRRADEDEIEERPRRRDEEKQSTRYRSDGRDRYQKPSDRGYRSDVREARNRRDDGYGTDRAPAKNDRRERDGYHSDKGRDRGSDRDGRRKSGFRFSSDDIGRYVEVGQKHYKNYKPLIDNLAKMYLDSKK